MIRLYDYWRSSASYRVRIALGMAGESWQTVPIDLVAGVQRQKSHLERNPQGLVPVLEIDGKRFTQSLAMIEYLDETRKLGLLPPDPGERAQVRALSYAIAMDIHPICNLRTAQYALGHSNGGVTMESWMQAFITPGLTHFEQMLGDGTYCYGSQVSMADLCLIPQLYNAKRWKCDVSGLPKIHKIEAALSQLKPFQDAHPDGVVARPHRPLL